MDRICEISLLLISLMLLVYSSYTDFKEGVIKNKAILLALGAIFPLLLFYYLYFYSNMISKYAVNVLLTGFISVLLYYLRIWGGGDSKLYAVVATCVPARYYFFQRGEFPLLELPVFIFSFGYIYLLFESAVYMFKRKERLSFPNRNAITEFLKSYFQLSVYMFLFSRVLMLVIPKLYFENVLVFWIISCLLSMIISDYPVFKNKHLIFIIFLIDIVLTYKNYSFNPLLYLIIFLLYLIKTSISKYNYKSKLISELKSGDVLSAGSTILLMKSRIKNIPNNISEDLSAKLNAENIEAINKWTLKNPDIKELTVVSKIPFAVFILLGYIYYLLLSFLR